MYNCYEKKDAVDEEGSGGGNILEEMLVVSVD